MTEPDWRTEYDRWIYDLVNLILLDLTVDNKRGETDDPS